MVDRFKETFELQEEAKKHGQERIADLMARVEVLEKETWDREDAREDFGSAGT
ncbi:MAG: hypothetical protein M1819_006420 [Sarea resinae]|nr:MAG: hypothetical protein M1819_006420 [Sarea resinae]